ncbi:MAG: ThiF family adenylyltransferase [Leucobacter sp.]
MPSSPHPGPLVAPAPTLAPEQRRRAERQLALPGFGEEAQRRLAAARVLVIGAGGLGSASVPYLVGQGVGTVGIVDDDRVELSNLHRQVAHGTADIGRSKVDSLAESAERLDPGARIERHPVRLTSRNALELFSRYDLVIDGSDNFSTRYLVNDAAELSGIPLVWGSILQHHGQVSVAWHRHGPGYRDLFPAPPSPDEVLSCGTGGVLPGLCGTIGSLLATEALKLITGIGDPLIGRVLVYDALAARTRELAYRRDPSASPVTGLIDYEAFCAGGAAANGATADGAAAGTDEVGAAELARLLRTGEGPVLLDVRGAEEHARASISGSRLLPLPDLESAARDDATPPSAATDADVLAAAGFGIGPDTDSVAGTGAGTGAVVVYCERGPRSRRAAQLLRLRGIDARCLSGGIRAFEDAAPELVERSADDR